MSSPAKIRLLNTCLATVCLILMFLIPLGVLVFWISHDSTLMHLDIARSGILQIETLQKWQLVCAAMFNFGIGLLMVVALNHLRLIFMRFKQGIFFSQSNTLALRSFSRLLLISVVLQCLSSSVLSVLLTWNNPQGERALVVTLGSNEFWLLFIAATFFAMVWSFQEGQRLAQENAEFV